MTTTLTTTPTYALPADAVQITATVNTAANFLRVWCTDAPVGSVYRNQLDKTGATRIEITPPNAPSPGGISPGVPFNAQLDKGGKYTFVAQEYTLGATSYGGGYSNAPDAYKTETKLGAEQTIAIYVGQRLTHRLGASNYGTASLLVYAWNATLRPTTLEVHGVESPAIINTSSPRAASAASASGVLTQLALFENAAVSTLAPNLQTLIAEMSVDLPRHFTNTGGVFHGVADTENGTEIDDLTTRYSTPNAVVRAAGVLFGRLRQHMQNGVDGSLRYHADPDFSHALITDGPGNEADLSLALAVVADVYRAYETHRVDTTSHLAADNVNGLGTTLGPLLSLHLAFLAALASLTPTSAGGTQSAVTTLNAYGFRLE